MDKTIDKNEIMGAFKGFALSDLKEIQEALRLEVKSRTEEAKIAEKAAKEVAKEVGLSMKDRAVIGATVSFTYKGGIKTGRVDKVTDKTFHINAEEFDLDYKAGGKLFRYIPFAHLVSVAEAIVADESSDESSDQSELDQAV